jgi:hypothetical protein
MRRRAVDVPAETAEHLRALHDGRRGDGLFGAYCLELRDLGWTWAAMGRAVGIGGDGVQLATYRARGSPAHDLPPLPGPPGEPDPPPCPVPDETVEHLRHLLAESQTVRGWTPADDPGRAAAREFGEIVLRLLKDGTPLAHVARAVGISARAVQGRLERLGLRPAPPSRSHMPLYGDNVRDHPRIRVPA